MSSRLAPVLAASFAVLVAACAGTAGTPAPSSSPFPSASPDSGDIDARYPELSIEAAEPGTLDVWLEDPRAKAWRIVVAGNGDAVGERLELVVETGDVLPIVELREIVDGELVDVVDLTGTIGEGAAAAGGCHGTLPVCIGSGSLRLPSDGDGLLGVRLDLPEPAELSIIGATAGWPGEPFVLGPWQETQPFVWTPG